MKATILRGTPIVQDGRLVGPVWHGRYLPRVLPGELRAGPTGFMTKTSVADASG